MPSFPRSAWERGTGGRTLTPTPPSPRDAPTFPALLGALAMTAADPPVAADLALVNGRVWTVDPARPEAQAVACWHGRILKVGSDAEVKALAGPQTKVID